MTNSANNIRKNELYKGFGREGQETLLEAAFRQQKQNSERKKLPQFLKQLVAEVEA